MKFLATLLSLASLALATSRTTAPSGALVVGSGGKYSTIQAAVNALSKSTTSAQSIFIEAGTYKEQVYVQALKGPLTIYGYTSNTASYTSNKVTITHSAALANSADDDESATLRVWTTNFKMYNVNVINTYGKGSQALVLSASAGNQGYYACSFTGYQDTILAETGAQLYAGCAVTGAVDFIFGQYAQAWFTKTEIFLKAASYGTITASGRVSNDAGYFVIDQSTVQAAAGETVPTGAYYLGRPWGDYARVIFQETSLSSAINAAGWHNWGSSDTRTDHVVFEEYDNTGAGASGTRASFSKKISSPIKIATVLGSSYASAKYVDTSYL